MKKTLIKYANVESTNPKSDFIKAVHVEDTSALLKMLKEANYIEVDRSFYTLDSIIYKVPCFKEELDVVYIFLDDMDD